MFFKRRVCFILEFLYLYFNNILAKKVNLKEKQYILNICNILFYRPRIVNSLWCIVQQPVKDFIKVKVSHNNVNPCVIVMRHYGISFIVYNILNIYLKVIQCFKVEYITYHFSQCTRWVKIMGMAYALLNL